MTSDEGAPQLVAVAEAKAGPVSVYEDVAKMDMLLDLLYANGGTDRVATFTSDGEKHRVALPQGGPAAVAVHYLLALSGDAAPKTVCDVLEWSVVRTECGRMLRLLCQTVLEPQGVNLTQSLCLKSDALLRVVVTPLETDVAEAQSRVDVSFADIAERVAQQRLAFWVCNEVPGTAESSAN